MRVVWQPVERKRPGGAPKIEQLKGVVGFAGTQVRAVDQAWVQRVNFGRRGQRLPLIKERNS